jgi:hypothetical protein
MSNLTLPCSKQLVSLDCLLLCELYQIGGRVTDNPEVILKSVIMELSPASQRMRKFSRLKNSRNTFKAHCRTFRTPG